MSVIVAIDPGTEQSALLVLDGGAATLARIADNDTLMGVLYDIKPPAGAVLAIEMVASYGMPVGREVFETVLWTGRFIEAWGRSFALVYRRNVKLHLCNSPRAKDAHVRQALLDRYGGRKAAMGTKRAPGPLYGIKTHLWAALAVAITYEETRGEMP